MRIALVLILIALSGCCCTAATVPEKDSRGYSYVKCSECWKKGCSDLPCFAALHWPGYDTAVFESYDGKPLVIGGVEVVIQLWRGDCKKFLGLESAPGGIGAEAGVYRRDKGRPKPTCLDHVAPSMKPMYEALDSNAAGGVWWPYPELGAKVTFTLTNTVSTPATLFFGAPEETTYWLCKWMDFPSYTKYSADQIGHVPAAPTGYPMHVTMEAAGKTYSWDWN